MFLKIFKKLKSILTRKTIAETSKSKKVNKTTKSKKTQRSSKVSKSKKQEAKLICESFAKLPGIGVKSAKAFYDAGFKSTKDIISAKDEELLAVPGVGINLVKKLRQQKPS